MNWDRVLYPLDWVGCHLLGRCFVGAFSLEGVLEVGGNLKREGFGVTYNLLGEHVDDPYLVDKAVDSTLRLIQQMSRESFGNVSCKPTLYGLSISKALFLQNMEKVVSLAKAKVIQVEFDAENYTHIEDTFTVFNFLASREGYSHVVRQAVQAHLKNILDLMDKYGLFDKNIRIVKGAGVYAETDSSAAASGNVEIRERYLEILRKNMEQGRRPYAATVRDRPLAETIIGLVQGDKRRFEFQMLFGPLGRKLGKHLLRLGYLVRIYIPFTDYWCCDEWKAYGLRRAKMLRGIFWREAKRILLLK